MSGSAPSTAGVVPPSAPGLKSAPVTPHAEKIGGVLHNTAAAAGLRPTEATYEAFQVAYDHFNRELFAAHLPACLITLQRRDKRTLGYFWAERFGEIGGARVTHEIAMNPQHFLHRPIRDTLSTLVHEMVHLWHHHFGSPGRSGYHNHEWAAKMKEIGLHPSDTGKPGGKEVGQCMSHYIVEGGRFALAFDALSGDGFRLAWGELAYRLKAQTAGAGAGAGAEDTNRSNRAKYTCPYCHANAWGRPGLHLICGTCGAKFVTSGR